MIDDVARVISRDFEEKHLARLIRYVRQPSVAATGNGIADMARLLKEDIDELGGDGSVVCGDGFPVVYGRFDVGAARTVLVHSQYDVWPPGAHGWIVDPFSASRMNWKGLGDCIVGRGAQDAKCQVALIYNAIEAYRAAGERLPVNIILVQAASVGGHSLAAFVADHPDLFAAVNVAWWPFLTGLPDRRGVVGLGARGLITGRMLCSGGEWGGPAESEIHSSNANLVANPAMELIRALLSMDGEAGLDELVPDARSGDSPPTDEDRALVDRLAEQISSDQLLDILGVAPFDQHDLRAALLDYCFKSEFTISELSAGQVIDGGHKAIVPRSASASIEVRTGEQVDRLVAGIERHLQALHPGVRWQTISKHDAQRLPIRHRALQQFLGTYADMGIEVQVWPTYAAGTVRPWTVPIGVPLLIGAPGHGGGNHSANEYIVVDGFRDACEFGVRLLHRLGSADG